LQAGLGDTLTSLYLYGAVTFPRPVDWLLDVDFHALLSAPPTDGQREAVAGLHRRLGEESPLGEELDGYYILLSDAAGTTPPTSVAGAFPSTGPALVTGPVDDAWALHRAHVLAGRVVVLHGTDPRTILPSPTWSELAEGLGSELDFVQEHPEHAAFGVLNACRIAWSCAHRDVVVSKWASATWAAQHEPRWRRGIEAAVRQYTQTPAPGDAGLLTAIRGEVLARARAALRDAAG